MPRTHRITPVCAVLFLVAAAGVGAACICIVSGRHVALWAAPEVFSDFCHAPAPSHSLPGSLRRDTSGADPAPGERISRDDARAGDALHGCDSLDIATRADRLALPFLKKEAKKKIKTLRKRGALPAAHVRPVSVIDFDPQKVSLRTHPAIPLLRTVILLV